MIKPAAALLPLLLHLSGRPAQADASQADGGGLCLLQDVKAKGGLRTRRRDAGAGLTPPEFEAPAVCGADGALAFSVALKKRPYFWANKNGDATCSGASPFASPFNVSKGPTWSFKDETASIVSTHPCIDEHKAIYLTHRNGKLRKFSPEGTLLWTNTENYKSGQAGQPVTGNPVLHNGAVFMGTVEGYVTAVDMATGVTRWQEKVAAGAGSDSWSLQALAGVVLVAMRNDEWKKQLVDLGGNNEVVAVDADDGHVLWRWGTSQSKPTYNWIGSFAADPPSVMFSTSDGRPHRLRLCDGSPLWEGEHPASETADFSTGGLIAGPDGIAYVTSNFREDGVKAGRLSAYNISTGELVWSRRQDMEANNAPAIGKLAGAEDKLSVVIAIGQNPGFPNPLAEATGVQLDGTPVAWRSKVLAFDAASGEPTGWQYSPPPHRRPQAEGDSFPDHICLPDAWSNGAIDGRGTFYLGHMSGNVFALRDADGDGRLDPETEVLSYYGGRCYQGSPGIAPGMLVTTPCDGMHVFTSA